MNFQFITFLSVASGVIASPIKPQGVVWVPFSEVKHLNEEEKFKRADDKQIVLNDRVFRRMELRLGTPPQVFSAVIDTVSGVSVIQTYSTIHPPSLVSTFVSYYNETYSQTFRTLKNASMSRTLKYGMVKGHWAEDVLTFNDVRIPNFFHVLADEASFDYSVAGIGVLPKKSDKVSLPTLLREGGAISYAAYSMWLNTLEDEKPDLVFGGFDRGFLKDGDIYRFPLVRPRKMKNIGFAIKLEKVYLHNSSTLRYLLAATSLPIVFDSGSAISKLPMSILRNLYSALNATTEDNGHTWTVPCDLLAGGNTGIGIQFSGVNFVFPFRDIIVAIDEKSKKCIPAFLPHETPLLGTNILRLLYVIYDLEKRELGVALARSRRITQDIVQLSTGIVGTKAPRYMSSKINFSIYPRRVVFRPQ